MKKTYIKPETKTVLMNVERLICDSARVVRGGSNAVTNPDATEGGVMEARRRNLFGSDYNSDLW